MRATYPQLYLCGSLELRVLENGIKRALNRKSQVDLLHNMLHAIAYRLIVQHNTKHIHRSRARIAASYAKCM